MWKTLLHYKRIHVAVILAAAVTTAVLTGSLLVGDSVRGSLSDLVLQRLGNIDQVLVSTVFFREKLAAELQQHPGLQQGKIIAVPAILHRGTAQHSTNNRRASQIQIQGITPEFANLYPGSTEAAQVREALQKPAQPFPPVVINESLRAELQAKVGEQILLRFEQSSEIPRESMLGEQDASEMVRSIRLTLAAVVPDTGIGRFGLHPGQLLPFNAFVPLPVLQRAVEQKSRANAIFFSTSTTRVDPAANRTALSEVWQLEDAGIRAKDLGMTAVSVETREVFLNDPISAAIEEAGAGLQRQPLLVYIANSIEINGKSVPYSTVAALETPANVSAFTVADGSTARIQPGEILLNRWAAEDLGAKQGDSVKLTYFVAGPGNELVTQSTEFQLAGIVEMSGLGADPALAPEFPGLQSGEDMADWEAPFPVDFKRIRDHDEEYWDEYRAAPKVFVSLQDGQRLWGNRFGKLTSIRFASDWQTEGWKQKLTETIRKNLRPEDAGLAIQNVRQRGLEAAQGSTDFSGLFIGFSMFLIVAACILTALLFRLGAEMRAPEIGLLLAIGYPERTVRRRLLADGLLLALIGSLIGVAGALGYTAALLAALRNWWSDAIGAPFLTLHASPVSLLAGALISLIVVFFSLWRSVRRLAKQSPPALLAGVTASTAIAKPRAWIRAAAWILPLLAILLSVAAAATGAQTAAGMFFVSGACLLAGGLCAFSLWMSGTRVPVQSGLGGMAVRNTVWNRTRSILSAALVCSACFVIVAVGANRRSPQGDTLRKNSGTGGFTLIAQSDVPLAKPLQSPQLQQNLGFANAPELRDTRSYSLRYLPGEDASCLNLFRPESPKVLGVPEDFIGRGGFEFTGTIAAAENPWTLLDQEIAADVIPAIGDANSVQWILHSGLGKDIEIKDARGRPLKLRLVGLIGHSIFQSELLISEKNFVKYFPSRSGYSYFLVDTPAAARDKAAQALESVLSDFGFDAVPAADRLARFHAVENTYISIFQTLGGLGLMLGTLGLAVIFVRNIAERRKELAALQAFGYRKSRVATMIWLENTFLLTIGILLGTASAVAAVLPQFASHSSAVPWTSLAITLALVFATGAIAGIIASYAALRAPLIPALRGE